MVSQYQKQIEEMKKEDNLTDFEMQLWLHKKGHELYDEQLDNDTDMEELCRLAMGYGFEWVEGKEIWVKRWIRIN